MSTLTAANREVAAIAKTTGDLDHGFIIADQRGGEATRGWREQLPKKQELKAIAKFGKKRGLNAHTL